MSPASRAFLTRHRLSLSLFGVVGFFGVVLPACGGPTADTFSTQTTLEVQPSTTPVVHGGQAITLTGVIRESDNATVQGTVSYSRAAQYASVFDVAAATGVVTALTVQSAAEVTVPVIVSGTNVESGFAAPPTVSKQITIRTRVASISVAGGGPTSLGADHQLTATPTIVSGSPSTPAPIMAWVSSNPTAVAVSNTGRVTVLQPTTGAVIITASSEGRSGTTEINVTNVGDPFAITTSSLPTASIGGTYSAVLASTGGPINGVVTWSLESGAMPSGITFGTNGVLTSSNVSATAGTYNITVRATSTIGVASVTTTKALSITVSSAPLVVSISPPGQIVAIGGLATFTMSQTDAAGNPVGTPPAVTWSLSSPTTALVQATPGQYRGESTGGTLVRATTAGGIVYTAALTVGARGAVEMTMTLGSANGPAADGALLEAIAGAGGVVASGVVGANRLGVIPGLAAGSYSIRVSKTGYVTQTFTDVVVTAGASAIRGGFIIPVIAEPPVR